MKRKSIIPISIALVAIVLAVLFAAKGCIGFVSDPSTTAPATVPIAVLSPSESAVSEPTDTTAEADTADTKPVSDPTTGTTIPPVTAPPTGSDKEPPSGTVPTDWIQESTTPSTPSESEVPTETQPPETEPSQPPSESAPPVTEPELPPPTQPVPPPETQTPTQPPPTEHTHTWKHIYHPATGQEVYYSCICSCGQPFKTLEEWIAHTQSVSVEEMLDHMSYHNGVIWEGGNPPWSEWVCTVCGESTTIRPYS